MTNDVLTAYTEMEIVCAYYSGFASAVALCQGYQDGLIRSILRKLLEEESDTNTTSNALIFFENSMLPEHTSTLAASVQKLKKLVVNPLFHGVDESAFLQQLTYHFNHLSLELKTIRESKLLTTSNEAIIN